MNISVMELNVLRYIKKQTFDGKKHYQTISSDLLIKKYGAECRYILQELYDSGYISCDIGVRSEGGILCIGTPEMDNWQITDKGLFCISENKNIQLLTAKERVINYFLGFGLGVISGCIIQLFIHYVINK